MTGKILTTPLSLYIAAIKSKGIILRIENSGHAGFGAAFGAPNRDGELTGTVGSFRRFAPCPALDACSALDEISDETNGLDFAELPQLCVSSTIIKPLVGL
jgi:hypothetical protein